MTNSVTALSQSFRDSDLVFAITSQYIRPALLLYQGVLDMRSPAAAASLADSTEYRVCDINLTDAGLIQTWYGLPESVRIVIRQAIVNADTYLRLQQPSDPVAPQTAGFRGLPTEARILRFPAAIPN